MSNNKDTENISHLNEPSHTVKESTIVIIGKIRPVNANIIVARICAILYFLLVILNFITIVFRFSWATDSINKITVNPIDIILSMFSMITSFMVMILIFKFFRKYNYFI